MGSAPSAHLPSAFTHSPLPFATDRRLHSLHRPSSRSLSLSRLAYSSPLGSDLRISSTAAHPSCCEARPGPPRPARSLRLAGYSFDAPCSHCELYIGTTLASNPRVRCAYRFKHGLLAVWKHRV